MSTKQYEFLRHNGHPIKVHCGSCSSDCSEEILATIRGAFFQDGKKPQSTYGETGGYRPSASPDPGAGEVNVLDKEDV
jgi:hypothetical protein